MLNYPPKPSPQVLRASFAAQYLAKNRCASAIAPSSPPTSRRTRCWWSTSRPTQLARLCRVNLSYVCEARGRTGAATRDFFATGTAPITRRECSSRVRSARSGSLTSSARSSARPTGAVGNGGPAWWRSGRPPAPCSLRLRYRRVRRDDCGSTLRRAPRSRLPARG